MAIKIWRCEQNRQGDGTVVCYFFVIQNEDKIWDISDKVGMMTGILLFVVTVDENMEQSKIELRKELEEFEKNDNEALVANKILVANGFEGIRLDEKSTSFENIIFYIVLGIVCLLVLFITPISPYKKRKKLSRGESAYAPHGSVGEIFHNGIDSKRED